MRLLRPNPAERRLLLEGHLAGPMPWVIAIMMFLTILAAASGLALGGAAQALGADLAGRVTIQLPEANPVTKAAQKQSVIAELRRLGVIEKIEPVSENQLSSLLEPWLGQQGIESGLPIPALIDVTLRRSTLADVEEVRQAVQSVAPTARVDRHSRWLAPLESLLRSLRWLAAALVVLMAAATATIVVLAARGALNTHRPVIEVMHLLGATDQQVAALFQRRIALDALLGGLVGLVAALAELVLVGQRISGLGSELLGSAGLGMWDWVLVLCLPLFGALLATIAARLTILFAIRRTL